MNQLRTQTELAVSSAMPGPTAAMQPPEDQGSPLVDLRRYAVMVRKRFWIIAAVLSVAIAAAVLYTKSRPKVYQATASVVIDPTPPQVFGNQVQEVIQLGAGSYWSNQEYYNTQLEILTRYDLIERTLERNPHLVASLAQAATAAGAGRVGGRSELDADAQIPPPDQPIGLGNDGPSSTLEPATPEAPPMANFADDLLDRDIDGNTRRDMELAGELLAEILLAEQTRESRIVRLSAMHTDPELAQDIANRHIDTFIDYHRNLRGENTGQITAFLERELAVAAKDLEASERALLAFKKDSDILSVSLEDRQNLLAADIARYHAAMSDARIARIELDSLRRRARALRDEEVMESPIFALAAGDSGAGTVSALKEQYVREKHRLAALGEELGPLHPEYQRQQAQVAQQYSALQAEARRALRELDERHQALVAREQQLMSEVDRLKSAAFALGDKATRYNQLEREQKSNEDKYQLVLNRLSASKLTERNTASNVHLHMRARSAELVYPRLSVNLAVAGVLALIVGLGLALLFDLLDRTLKSPEHVEKVAEAPLLGIIPAVPASEISGRDEAERARRRDFYVAQQPASRVAEHCRSIRTNILFSSATRPMKVFTISSPRQAEGKTTTALYLGTAMAQSKQRVLIIDTDMRRPRLHAAMDLPLHRGLSELLLPDTDLDQALSDLDDAALDHHPIIKTTQVPGLYVLPCGLPPPNPAELLLTDRFGEILKRLRAGFDRVLLDSPPLMLMNDAVVLSRLSDGVIMVTQAGRTSVDDVARSARMVRAVEAPILGVILNNVASGDSSNYGDYYRGYGYGDYGEEADGGDGGGNGSDREGRPSHDDSGVAIGGRTSRTHADTNANTKNRNEAA